MAQNDPNISRIRDEAAPRPVDARVTPDAVAGPLADPRRWIALGAFLAYEAFELATVSASDPRPD